MTSRALQQASKEGTCQLDGLWQVGPPMELLLFHLLKQQHQIDFCAKAPNASFVNFHGFLNLRGGTRSWLGSNGFPLDHEEAARSG